MKWVLGYWILGCLVVGAAIGDDVKTCPHDQRPPSSEIALTVLTWPWALSAAISGARAPTTVCQVP